MRKFVFHLGVTLRSYGNVEIEAESVEAALPLLTADFIGENIAIIETTTDSGQDLAIIDVFDAETDEALSEWAGHPLPSPYDPKPGADLAAALKELVRCVRGGDETAGVSMDDALIDADDAIAAHEAVQ